MNPTDVPTLVVGNKNLSSWSLRPWLLLAHAGIAFREEALDYDLPDFDARVRVWSPTGKVPALVHGGLVVWESIAICEYVAERWPEARLWPEDPAARALARAVSAEMHAGFAAMREELSMDITGRYPTPPGLSAAARADVDRVQALWRDCRSRGGRSQGPFLFGRFSVADAMFAPVCTRLVTYSVDVADDTREYVETILALPAMKRWAADAAREVATSPAPAPPPRDGRVSSGAPWEAQVGYCRAIRRGPLVAVSGTAPVDPGGATHAPGDAYAQARRCFAIATDALARLGARPEHVTRTRMFVTDASRWAEFGRAHAEAFGAHPPATTLVEVAALIAPDMLIEVEVDAWVA